MGSVDEFEGLRRELQRLRAENARLSRLLQLRGQDTAPAPEQLSAPVAAPGLVTMASPVADKLALFADRFRARVDVYAVRWENSRTGAAGWMPAVAGGWRKGMDRRGAAYLPRTAEVAAAHLVGDVFLGLYPLLPGNTRSGRPIPSRTSSGEASPGGRGAGSAGIGAGRGRGRSGSGAGMSALMSCSGSRRRVGVMAGPTGNTPLRAGAGSRTCGGSPATAVMPQSCRTWCIEPRRGDRWLCRPLPGR